MATGTRGALASTAPELPAAAEVSTAARLATASDRVGVGLTGWSVKDSVSDHRTASPVQVHRSDDDRRLMAGAR